MATIRYIEFNGTEHLLDLPAGTTLMQGAMDHSVRGIIADCGGCCSCATCHVYIDPAWTDKVGAQSDMEAVMLEEVCDPQPNSRLSCQIVVTDALDGLIVRVPERQF